MNEFAHTQTEWLQLDVPRVVPMCTHAHDAKHADCNDCKIAAYIHELEDIVGQLILERIVYEEYGNVKQDAEDIIMEMGEHYAALLLKELDAAL